MSDRPRDKQSDREMLACKVVIAGTELVRTVGSSVVVTETMWTRDIEELQEFHKWWCIQYLALSVGDDGGSSVGAPVIGNPCLQLFSCDDGDDSLFYSLNFRA